MEPKVKAVISPSSPPDENVDPRVKPTKKQLSDDAFTKAKLKLAKVSST